MAVALHDHHGGYVHGAVFADAAEIVATQVHQHDMLGALFRIVEQVGGQLVVLGGRLTPPAGPGDGM